MRIFSKDASMRKDEITVLIVNTICLILGILLFFVNTPVILISITNIKVIAVMLLMISVMLTLILSCRIKINLKDNNYDK